MSCERIQDLLSPYLDGDLTPGERADVDAHLDACPDCAAEREAGYLAGATSAPLREPASRPCHRHREARRELIER